MNELPPIALYSTRGTCLEREEVFSPKLVVGRSVGHLLPTLSVCLSDRVSISRRLSSGDVVSVFAIPPLRFFFFLTVEKPFPFSLFLAPPGRSSLSLCCCARGQQQQSVVHSNVSPPPPFMLFSLIPFLCGGMQDMLPWGYIVRRCRLAHNVYICKAMLMCFPPHLCFVDMSRFPSSVGRQIVFLSSLFLLLARGGI